MPILLILIVNLFLAPVALASSDAIKNNGDKPSVKIEEEFFASYLGLSIIGTIVSRGSQNVVLLKNQKSGKVEANRIGFKILEKYIISEISQNFIQAYYTENNGSKKYVKIYKDGFTGAVATKKIEAQKPEPYQSSYSEDGFEREKNKIKMTDAYRDKLIKEDLSKILMQASAEPVVKDGQIFGFRIDQIEENSIYAKAGLKDFDIVTSINEIPLDDVTMAIKLLHSLKKSDSIKFDVLRNDQKISVQVDVN